MSVRHQATLMDSHDADDDGELILCSSNGQSEEIAELSRFDEYVEALQGFVSDDGFGEMQSQFMAKYVHVFEEGEENKLEYMPIYQEWVALMERLLEEYMEAHVSDYDQEEFMHLVAEHESEVDPLIIDFIASLADFLAFKELALDYKRGLEFGDSISGAVTVCGLKQLCGGGDGDDVADEKRGERGGQRSVHDDITDNAAGSGNRGHGVAGGGAQDNEEGGNGDGGEDNDDGDDLGLVRRPWNQGAAGCGGANREEEDVEREEEEED